MEHDTIIVTQPDSATFWAWVTCDSLGQVLIEELNAERGRRTAITPRVVSNGRQTLISVSASTAPENVIVRRREVSHHSSHIGVSKTEEHSTKQAPRHTLREYLSAVVVFLIGVASGYLFKAIKP